VNSPVLGSAARSAALATAVTRAFGLLEPLPSGYLNAAVSSSLPPGAGQQFAITAKVPFSRESAESR
jgi:hypothetical protein